MTGTFLKDFQPTFYTIHKMLEMQADEFKLKKDFEVRSFHFVKSRFPQHYELYVEVTDDKQYMQLLTQRDGGLMPACCFVPVLPPGGRK